MESISTKSVTGTDATGDDLGIPEFLRRSPDEPKQTAAETKAKADAEVEMTNSGTTNCATDTKNSGQPKGWRDILPIHPAAEKLPLMSEAELCELAADIAENGLQEPVAVYNDPGIGMCLLDGRNRLDALALLGRETVSEINGRPPNGCCRLVGEHERVEPFAYVVSANVHRRHLSAERRAILIIEIIAMKPDKSDRQIAKEIGVDHKTVGRARAKGEDVGRIPHVKARTDTKGRKQPTIRKTAKLKSPSSTPEAAVLEPSTSTPKQKTAVVWDVESNAEETRRKALQCKQSAADAQVVIEAAGVLDEMTIGAVIKAATDAKEACIAAAVAWQALTESVRK